MAYKIKSGDTLSQIAKDNNTTVQAIMDLNPSITNPNKIFAGNTINLPSSGASSSVPSSAGSTSLKNNQGSNSTNLNFAGSKPEGWSEENWNTAANALSKYNEASAYLENELKSIYGDTTIEDIFKQISDRDPFSYDFSTDPLFQNMLGSYQAMGQTAMKDAVAQSSALTGGYGNSWAQTAGQQTYNQYLQNAFDNLPEYYQLALSTYQQEGQNLKDKYTLASAERDRAVSEIMTIGNLKKEDAEKLYDTAMELGQIGYNDYWKNKEYNYTAEKDRIANNRAAQSLAMQEAEMKANGYVKQSDGTWKYVGSDEDDDREMDALITLGVEAAYKRDGIEGAMQFLKDYGKANNKKIDEGDYDYYLASIGATSSTTTPAKKSLTKQQALSALASNLLGKRSEFEKENEAYDLSGLANFYNPTKKSDGYKLNSGGGPNWFWGIDGDASIDTPYGTITMDEMYNALVAGGVSEAKAKEYVINIQKEFGL